MKILALAFVCLSSVFSVYASEPFPVGPDPGLTPGSLCASTKTLRYDEKIPYCSRDVDSSLKNEIIALYDDKLGFQVEQMKRVDFKIDHFIPLCMGGSNQPNNLWPQHKSVFAITDPLEGTTCLKMEQGKILQAEAVALIRRAKADLMEAKKIISYVQGL